MPAALHTIGTNAAARRRKPRVAVRLFAIVRGTDASGGRFEMRGQTLDLGGGGVYLHLPCKTEVPRRVFVAIRFGAARGSGAVVPQLAVRGTVLRVDSRTDGTMGVAVGFRQFRFV